MKISLSIKDDSIKIFIDNILHLSLNQDKLLGVQAWVSSDKYIIQFYMNGNSIVCEYGNNKMWKKVLKLLEQNNLYNSNF